jgi:transcriptional regulator with XRE-family HTH domain
MKGGDYMEFSERLRRLREQKGLKQNEMAKLLNMQSSTYNGYEKGRRAATSDLIERISRALGVDPNTLLGYEVQKNTEMLVSEYLNLIKLLDIKEIEIIKDFKSRNISLVDVVNDLKMLADKYK